MAHAKRCAPVSEIADGKCQLRGQEWRRARLPLYKAVAAVIVRKRQKGEAMRWRGRRQSSNVEDRRGRSGARLPGGFGRIGGRRRPTMRRAGGGGIGFIVIILILSFVFGINPLELLSGGGQVSVDPGSRQTQTAPQVSSEMRDFVATVLAETEDTWNAIFTEEGLKYSEPTLVLFSGSVRSACGFASAASGPFYCPGDSKVYIDLAFYDQLKRRFQAPGDFAQAYVLAHEVGHHVQNLIGVLPKFNQMRRTAGKSEANAMSVRVELQADCFAGIWANKTARKGLLEEGDIDEALNAARQIGDDTIQKRTQGYVVPDAFNHGTAEQRRRWFGRGFETGRLDACDTFTPNQV
jgi:predicted metalloprotease